VTAFRPSTSAQQTSDFTVLFAGIISPRKGIRYLLEAVRSLSIPGLRIRLVGQKEVADAALAPYEDFITHVAHVPRPMMPEQYHQADLYVLPTLCEGSSNTIYEAMASGLPVITTPNAGSVIRDGQDGYIVPIRSAEAIAQRIEQLYIDRELAAAMGARGRARALQFTWEAYGRHLGQCLRGLWEETVRAASNQASPPGPPEPIRVPSPEVPA
jgi:glycosyltransferase involved in cell wall biosynthesis